MNKLILSILICFIFLFPGKVFSTTFKCEFVQEKFDGGKSNVATCSGQPEILNRSPRTKLCDVGYPVTSYSDFIDFKVDLNEKTISYTEVNGMTQSGIESMVRYHKKKGNKTEEEARKDYSKVRRYKSSNIEILSINTSKSSPDIIRERKPTKQYLIVYKIFLGASGKYHPRGSLYSLFIPSNGLSVHTYHASFEERDGDMTWSDMKFGKCFQTSE